VYFGVNLDTGELIAVKQVPIIGFAYETAHEKVQELQQEIEILEKLHHKNIVRYFGSNRDDEFLNIFLEYIPGGSIASLLEKYGKFPETLIRVYTR
jgi:serine/threonine protein kinase